MGIDTQTLSNGAEWYRIRLTRSEYEGGEVSAIQGAFQQIYFARNAPQGMAMLGVEGEGGEAYFVYFTPNSLPHVQALINAYSAIPHAPPSSRGLCLIFGDTALPRHAGATFEA